MCTVKLVLGIIFRILLTYFEKFAAKIDPHVPYGDETPPGEMDFIFHWAGKPLAGL
jgi:hypothetical protein